MNVYMDIPSPYVLKEKVSALRARWDSLKKILEEKEQALQRVQYFLELGPKVAARLEILSKNLFENLLDEIEANLTYALQDILGQNIRLMSRQEIKYDKIHIYFFIERDGHEEDILRGQGGSVCNILSVGLRFITLTQLDEKNHRRFIVLDEQDCWIRPDLIPRFMAVIRAISKRLQFQVLVISHHDVELFRDYADIVYRLNLKYEPDVTVVVHKERDVNPTLVDR